MDEQQATENSVSADNVTTSPAVQYNFDELHDDFYGVHNDVDGLQTKLELINSNIIEMNNNLKALSLGIDFIICILVIFLVSKFLLNFFDRGFK